MINTINAMRRHVVRLKEKERNDEIVLKRIRTDIKELLELVTREKIECPVCNGEGWITVYYGCPAQETQEECINCYGTGIVSKDGKNNISFDDEIPF